jgi:fengycin family lipopeptide synthetase D
MVLMDTGCHWASAFIGVMMAGGMVLCIDPSNPRPRIHKIILETNVRNIIVDTHHRRLAISLGFEEDQIINMDEPIGSSSVQLPEPPDPDDLAQAIQTSGSTGLPHITIHRHATVASNAERQARVCGLGPDDRLTIMGSPAVYGPARDLLVAALSGSSVHVWQTPRLGLAGVVPWMRRQDITAMMVVPTIFRGVMSNAPEGLKLPRLRLVLLGGEPARGSDARAVARLSDTADIGWHLTSSETGMITHERSRAVDVKDLGQLPLGRLIPGLEVFLVKSGQVITESGQAAQLAHDLMNVQVGTMVDGKVVEVDSVDIDGRRCWIGSDLLEYDPEGRLVFVGRDDRMVKIQGNRIDRSEIESALLEHRGIVDAVVGTREHKGELRLHAWYVRRKNTYAYAGELREHLRFRLPTSYIPDSFIRVDSISRNNGGKVDHSKLTVPDRKKKESVSPGRTGSSRTATMIEIWKHALQNEDIGPDTDFHHAGGDSISSISIAFSIERIFGRTIKPHIFEQSITPTQVIQFMEQGESVVRPLLLDFGDKTGERKELLFCLTGVGGSIMRYRTLADHFAEDWRVCAIRYPGEEHGRTPNDDVGMIADRLAAEIVNRLPDGPIHLVGYCFGGVIAHEIACRLQDMGRTIGRLVLVDAIVPLNNPDIEINRELHGVNIDEKTLLSFMGDDESSVMNTMHQELRWNLSAVLGHVPGVFKGDGLVIRCRQQPEWRPKNAESEIKRWTNHFAGEIRESVVDIEHLKLMESQGVEAITEAIRTWISNSDSLTLLESDTVHVT